MHLGNWVRISVGNETASMHAASRAACTPASMRSAWPAISDTSIEVCVGMRTGHTSMSLALRILIKSYSRARDKQCILTLYVLQRETQMRATVLAEVAVYINQGSTLAGTPVCLKAAVAGRSIAEEAQVIAMQVSMSVHVTSLCSITLAQGFLDALPKMTRLMVGFAPAYGTRVANKRPPFPGRCRCLPMAAGFITQQWRLAGQHATQMGTTAGWSGGNTAHYKLYASKQRCRLRDCTVAMQYAASSMQCPYNHCSSWSTCPAT
jgi:hypothetical protein